MATSPRTRERTASRRPRLLFLSHLLPYPADYGAAIRTGNVLRILSDAFDVTALCLARRTDSQNAGSIDVRVAALTQDATVDAFPIASEYSRVRKLVDHMRSMVLNRPYVQYVYDSAAFRTRLLGLLNTRDYDLVHVDSLDLAGYLPAVLHLPVVCVHHNVESALLRRRSGAEGAFLMRWYLRRQANLIEGLERTWCPQVQLNVAVSDEDCRQLRSLAPAARFSVYPNGVDVNHYRPGHGRSDGLAFVGGTTWFPNRDALQFFCRDILPLLHERGQFPATRWVGKAAASEREQFANVRGLTLTGYVEDERPDMRNAACFIVPLRVGGGTRLKILNAWAMGKAVVSTSVGCEGLATRHGDNILIADEPADFSAAVDAVLRDPDLRARLGAGARATAEQQYSWPVIGARMVEEYQELLHP